jgi:hypothetical protein
VANARKPTSCAVRWTPNLLATSHRATAIRVLSRDERVGASVMCEHSTADSGDLPLTPRRVRPPRPHPRAAHPAFLVVQATPPPPRGTHVRHGRDAVVRIAPLPAHPFGVSRVVLPPRVHALAARVLHVQRGAFRVTQRDRALAAGEPGEAAAHHARGHAIEVCLSRKARREQRGPARASAGLGWGSRWTHAGSPTAPSFPFGSAAPKLGLSHG